jgi:hypothetical protein
MHPGSLPGIFFCPEVLAPQSLFLSWFFRIWTNRQIIHLTALVFTGAFYYIIFPL